MNRLLSLSDEIKDAYNEFRLARDCNIAAYQLSIQNTHIDGDPFDMLGANERATSARKWLLDACEVAEFELRRSKCSASNLLRFIAAVRDGDSTPEAWQRVLDMWPDAYACVRDGSAEEYRVACEQQAEPSNADGAAPVVDDWGGDDNDKYMTRSEIYDDLERKGFTRGAAKTRVSRAIYEGKLTLNSENTISECEALEWIDNLSEYKPRDIGY